MKKKSGKNNERTLKIKIDNTGGQTKGQTDFNSQNPPTEPGVHWRSVNTTWCKPNLFSNYWSF